VNSIDRSREQAIALAAVIESAILVDQLARTGTAPVEEMQALTESLFRFEWESVDEVFGGSARLRRGVETLAGILRQSATGDYGNVMRYTLSMLYLGRTLARDKEKLGIIRSRLQHAALKSAHFSTRFDELAASIAAVYQDTISTYRYRIQVTGTAAHLQNPLVADRIRTLLLAGLRAAVLWRFVGGSRLKTVLRRARMLAACSAILARES
jgi:high frequency lysogenization protein